MADCNVPAVAVQHLTVGYSYIKSKTEVLKDVSLNINSGTIYALLGSNGCGKTTLLKCIIGLLTPTYGSIKVFGEILDSANSVIPGSGVGYMPQELALFEELSIVETFHYFGCLYLMKYDDIKERITSLLMLFKLPDKRKLIKYISTGQKRRVSFAVALLHRAPLLILDEPTVGVDPMLREIVWKYLLDLCTSDNVTIIISTHYIEEARQANKIGFLRNGKILIEDEPLVLLDHYNVTSLDHIFLKLCKEDDNKNSENVDEHKQLSCKEHFTSENKKTSKLKQYIPSVSAQRIKGLALKNFIRIRRSILLIIFLFLIPATSVATFCIIVDGVPNHIPVAILNEDLFFYGSKFLRQLNTDEITQVPVETSEEGIASVTNGNAIAFMHIWKNFTTSLLIRLNAPRKISEDITKAGSIHLYQDYTNQEISYYFAKSLTNAMIRFANNTVGDIRNFPSIIINNFKIDKPIYGDKDDSSTSAMLSCGLLFAVIHFLALSVTSTTFVVDNKNGLLQRSYVAGASLLDIMFGYLIIHLGVTIVQVALSLLFSILLLDIFSNANLLLIALITTLQAIQGMALGFLISVIVTDEKAAFFLATCIFFPCIYLSGSFWPLEAAPEFLKIIAKYLPLTMATESVKWIALRYRNFTWTPVWSGAVATTIWILIYLVLSVIVLRFKQRH